MTILETPRLTLRELTAEDAEALLRVLSDPEAMRYYPAPYDRAGVEPVPLPLPILSANRGFGDWEPANIIADPSSRTAIVMPGPSLCALEFMIRTPLHKILHL